MRPGRSHAWRSSPARPGRPARRLATQTPERRDAAAGDVGRGRPLGAAGAVQIEWNETATRTTPPAMDRIPLRSSAWTPPETGPASTNSSMPADQSEETRDQKHQPAHVPLSGRPPTRPPPDPGAGPARSGRGRRPRTPCARWRNASSTARNPTATSAARVSTRIARGGPASRGVIGHRRARPGCRARCPRGSTESR